MELIASPPEAGAMPVEGVVRVTPWLTVPGIGAGAAYVSGDAMGDRFSIPVSAQRGEIVAMSVMDLDKESLPFDVLVFGRDFTPTADNAAFDLADPDIDKLVGYIRVEAPDYVALNDSSVGRVTDIGLHYVLAPGVTALFAQCVTRGAPNYTAARDLSLRFTVRVAG